MNAQQENLAEELVNRDFVYVEEVDAAVMYEKDTREGNETVTIFKNQNLALHERWNKNGVLTSDNRYNTNLSAEMTRLLSSCH